MGVTVSNGGYQDVESGSVANNTTILSGGDQYDNATAIGATVLSGGEQDVQGLAGGTTVSSGGLLIVESGAVASGATVASGGEVVVDGGTFSGTLASGAIEVNEVVSSGTTVSSETVTSGLFQTVLSGGSTISVAVDPYGEQDVYGTTTGTVISSGGSQYIYSGTASGTVISAGGYQDVYGTTSNTTVSSGGIEVVESGGVAEGTTVLSGGELVVSSGATASGVIVLSGGEIVSSAGAIVENLMVSGGGEETSVISGRSLVATASVEMTTSLAAHDRSSVEATVAKMIQSLATFNAGLAMNQGALFEPVSSGLLHEEVGTLVGAHRVTSPR
jgi:fibronectin-binding autotransporter adhesin